MYQTLLISQEMWDVGGGDDRGGGDGENWIWRRNLDRRREGIGDENEDYGWQYQEEE